MIHSKIIERAKLIIIAGWGGRSLKFTVPWFVNKTGNNKNQGTKHNVFT